MNARRYRAGRSRFAANRSGVSAVEFALTAPILFLFLFAALEFSRYNMILQTANNAAFEAARTCIVPGATASNGQTAGANILSASGISGGTVTIATIPATSPPTITNTTTQITATVTIPITCNLWTSAVFCKGTSTTKSCTLTSDWVDSAP
jgi:Flp pilus assembly protein TadG